MIKLTFPKSHERQELRPLFELFKETFPNEFLRWETRAKGYLDGTLEASPKFSIDPVFAETHQRVASFLKDKTGCVDSNALSMAWLDFRIILDEDLRGRSNQSGPEHRSR